MTANDEFNVEYPWGLTGIFEKNIGLDHSKAPIYSQVDGLSLQNIFYAQTGEFPSCFMFCRSQVSHGSMFDTTGMLDHFRSLPEGNTMASVVYSTLCIDDNKMTMSFSVIFPERKLYARVSTNISETYILYRSGSEADVKWLVDEMKKFYVVPAEEKNNIFLLSQPANGGYTLNKWKIDEVEDFDVNEQYNDDFKAEYDNIDRFLSNDEAGLVVLHGEKGTGKSTCIRNFITRHPERKFIFINSGLIGLLGTPAFNDFLFSLEKCIIILEDCEDALKARKEVGSSPAVGILLNMSDGLLADNLRIKFICTFNEDISSIDDALLRKGRMKGKYRFEKLSAKKSQKLMDRLYGDQDLPVPTVKNPMSLADIYNYYSNSYEETRRSII